MVFIDQIIIILVTERSSSGHYIDWNFCQFEEGDISLFIIKDRQLCSLNEMAKYYADFFVNLRISVIMTLTKTLGVKGSASFQDMISLGGPTTTGTK